MISTIEKIVMIVFVVDLGMVETTKVKSSPEVLQYVKFLGNNI